MNKYRVVICKEFPSREPIITFAEDEDEAKGILRKLTNGDFQSSQIESGVKPGCRNIAVIEKWNDAEQEWEFIADNPDYL